MGGAAASEVPPDTIWTRAIPSGAPAGSDPTPIRFFRDSSRANPVVVSRAVAAPAIAPSIDVIPQRSVSAPARGIAAPRLSASSDSAAAEPTLSMQVLLSGAARVRNRIFDNLGVFVAALDCEVTDAMLHGAVPGADGRVAVTLQWNLRTQAGVPVPPGVYLWKLLVTPETGAAIEKVQKVGVRQGG